MNVLTVVVVDVDVVDGSSINSNNDSNNNSSNDNNNTTTHMYWNINIYNDNNIDNYSNCYYLQLQ